MSDNAPDVIRPRPPLAVLNCLCGGCADTVLSDEFGFVVCCSKCGNSGMLGKNRITAKMHWNEWIAKASQSDNAHYANSLIVLFKEKLRRSNVQIEEWRKTNHSAMDSQHLISATWQIAIYEIEQSLLRDN